MEGDEFWNGEEFWNGKGDPAIQSFNTMDETWSRMAGSTEERFVPTMERKVWMKMDVMELEGRDIKIIIRGLFERINPLTYSATLEGYKISLYERDEKLKVMFPKILKLHDGVYKYIFSNIGSAKDKLMEISVCEIPDISTNHELQYQCELLFKKQD